MPVHLIQGPPNSGRSEAIRELALDALDRDPVLVVPNADDASRLELQLCEEGRAVLGISIRTFSSLFADIARQAGVVEAPPLGGPQRLALVRAAVERARLRLLARSARRAGFAPAVATLLTELQAALVGPDELALRAADLDEGEYESELARIYAAYRELREQAGRSDAGSRAERAIAAVRERPDSWGGRPILIYGFDDLTRAQLELVRAVEIATEVTIAVNYDDREALRARARLAAQLGDELSPASTDLLAHDPLYTDSTSLRHLDLALFEPGAGPVADDGAVTLVECAGELGEAEAIAARIARLLADGEPPDSIAVVVRDPGRRGPLLGRVLARMAIPVAVQASIPLGSTGVGSSLTALCRAMVDDDPEALLGHLRADPSTPPELADGLELTIRRRRPASIDEAIDGWERPPRHLRALREAAESGREVLALARVARELAESAHAATAPLAGAAGAGQATPFDPLEQRAARVAAELVDELAEVGRLPGCSRPTLEQAIEALESASVEAWRGPSDGRVRVLSPYGARARRARHLFCAGLQEGEFPRRIPGDPLLGDDRRARLQIAALARRDPLDEERYLFHACVSRPTDSLHLSWQGATDEGAPAARSPFVDEVLELLEPTGDRSLVSRRGLDRVTFAPAEAPTVRELARAEALAGPRAPEQRPGPLRDPAVLAELQAREVLSASTLEQWVQCPYRWFVEHELRPQRLEPEADALRLGSIAHAVLERLFGDPPGLDSIPRPGDLARWRERCDLLLDEVAAELGMRPDEPPDSIALARLRAQLGAFLADESELETELRPDTDLLEAGFGFGDDEAGALDLGTARLRGRIDRIDLSRDGSLAVVRDYKTSSEVVGRRAWERRGKLQLQLYVLAARERLGLAPAGGLYTALGARDDRRPRGMLLRDEPRLGELPVKRGDACDEEEFERELDRARELAGRHAAAMRAGRIGRDPLNGRCPRYCEFQPICRLERAIGLDEEGGANGDE